MSKGNYHTSIKVYLSSLRRNKKINFYLPEGDIIYHFKSFLEQGNGWKNKELNFQRSSYY